MNNAFKLVPIEPTKDMLYAVQEACDILPPRGKRVWTQFLNNAPTTQIDHRADFESRFKLTERQAQRINNGDSYRDSLVQLRWEGWRAAKESGY